MKKAKTAKKQTGDRDVPELMKCCQMRAVVTVDKRGQLVLPKKLRQEVGIKAGDKLAVMSLGLKNSYSLLFTKVDDVSKMMMIKIIDGLGETRVTVKK